MLKGKKNKEEKNVLAFQWRNHIIPYEVLKLVLFPVLNFLLRERRGDFLSISVLSYTHTSSVTVHIRELKENYIKSEKVQRQSF